MKIEKPKQQIHYDLSEAKKYIKQTYKLDDKSFWEEKLIDDVHNGMLVYLTKDELEDTDEYIIDQDEAEQDKWKKQREIYLIYLKEFADDNGDATFYYWW